MITGFIPLQNTILNADIQVIELLMKVPIYMKKLIALYLLFSLTAGQTLFSQNASVKIDSLKLICNSSITDSARIKIFRKIGVQFEMIHFDSAIYYHNQTIKIAEENKWPSEKASALVNIGFAYKYALNSEESIDYLLKGLTVYKNAKDKKGELDTYYNLGIFAGSFENFVEAVKYYEQAVILGREQKDTIRLGMIYNNLGLTCQYIGDFSKSVKYQILALKIKEEIGDKTICISHINIGLNYNTLSKSEDAKWHFNNALMLLDSTNFNGKAICYNEIGTALSNEDSLASAIIYYEKAFELYKKNKGLCRL